MREKVLIVGAGPGGLSAAILLAAAGLKVTILERLDTVGGRTSTIRADGFSSTWVLLSSFIQLHWKRSSRPQAPTFGKR